MTMRRATAAVSAVLLVLLSVAIAEAALLTLLVVFSYILRLNFGVQLGDQYLQLWFPPGAESSVGVHQAGVIGSTVVTLASGVGAAVWRYRRWSPA